MKKKYGIAILSVLIIVASAILLVNKSSYASEPTNYCLDIIDYVDFSSSREEIEGIELPETVAIEDIHSFKRLGTVFYSDAKEMNYEWKNPSISTGNIYATVMEKGKDISPEIGYLLTQLNFSNNKKDNNYYQQLLLFWAIDRLKGFDDDHNYIWSSEESDFIQTEKNKNMENNIPASIKTYIKSQPIGTKMLSYLEEWENYVNWSLQENKKLEMDKIDSKDITYTFTNDYLETNLITPTNKDKPYEKLFDGYQVEVEKPFIVVNSDGEEQTTFGSAEGFKIRIPISKIENNNINYSIIVKGIYTIQNSPIYNSPIPQRLENSTKKEELILDLEGSLLLKECMIEEQKEATMNINYNLEVGTLNIKVIDAESKEELKNAEVVIYDQAGNIVYRYKTTGSTLNITLPVGEYTVKQIITPPNYQARVVEQKVTITENGETDAVLENIQLIEVPDTGKTISNIIVFGTIITLIGISLILITFKRRKEAK